MSPIHRAPVRISPITRSRPIAGPLALPTLLTLFLASALALGCASRAPAPGLDPPPAQPTPVAETKDAERVAVDQASVRLEPVYFDTNRAVLRIDARDSLKSHAKAIIDHPEWGVITIDGHCDERGSDQYNLALGRSRAVEVERYLVKMGVPPARVAIRTFGAGRPAVAGHDESAWSYNRRSEFQVDRFASTTPAGTGNSLRSKYGG